MGDRTLYTGLETHTDFTGFSGKPEELISLLQSVQKQQGYISRDSIRQISQFLKISEAQVFGVASFYSQFRFTQPGENTLRICQGTACHVQGGDQLVQEAEKSLGIHPGETSPDHHFDFQEVACLGCCAQASVAEINGKIYGKLTPDLL